MKQLKQIKGLEEQIGVEERKKQIDECGTIRKDGLNNESVRWKRTEKII